MPPSPIAASTKLEGSGTFGPGTTLNRLVPLAESCAESVKLNCDSMVLTVGPIPTLPVMGKRSVPTFEAFAPATTGDTKLANTPLPLYRTSYAFVPGNVPVAVAPLPLKSVTVSAAVANASAFAIGVKLTVEEEIVISVGAAPAVIEKFKETAGSPLSSKLSVEMWASESPLALRTSTG